MLYIYETVEQTLQSETVRQSNKLFKIFLKKNLKKWFQEKIIYNVIYI